MTGRTVAAPARVGTMWLALVTVYLVWGSTYLAIRVVVRTAPPLLAMGVRFLVAGVLLATVIALRSGPRRLAIDRRRLAGSALVGLLLLLGGNGLVAVAEKTVPSGLAALVVASTPLWLVVLRLTVARERVGAAHLLGTALGFAGIAALVLPGGRPDRTAHRCGLPGCSSSSPRPPRGRSGRSSAVGSRCPRTPSWRRRGRCWPAASVWCSPRRRPASSGLPGGRRVGARLVRAGLPGRRRVDRRVLGVRLAAANAPLSLTATYAYVNPVVAVALGALLLDEPVTGAVLVGGAVVVAGVCLVVSSERPRRQPRPPSAARLRTARRW